MSRLTSLPWRGWGEAMPGRRAGGDCAARPREHTIVVPPRISWRCRFYPITSRMGSPSLASSARRLSGITSDVTSAVDRVAHTPGLSRRTVPHLECAPKSHRQTRAVAAQAIRAFDLARGKAARRRRLNNTYVRYRTVWGADFGKTN